METSKGATQTTAVHLPALMTTTVGRASEIAELVELLCQQGTRLVTLTGPGGCRKNAARGGGGQSEQTSGPRREQATNAPYNLTTRELDVLRLLAEGHADARIAKMLVISPRTVNTHLRSIYAKLGVSSRSGATRIALEQKLI